MATQGSSSSHIKWGQQDAGNPERSLPDSYGKTEASLLPRDPRWMFIYWDITEEKKKNIRKEHGEDVFSRSNSVVRVHDVTGVADFNGSNSSRHSDVPITLEARNWYIQAQESGRSYCCEIGIILPDGRFILLARTNTVGLPPGRVSDAVDEKWMSVSEDFEKLLELSGIQYIGRGSGEIAKSLAQRWEMLGAIFSRAASWGITSLPSGRRPEQKRGFWLIADCEIVLYGATEPDAQVTVAGYPIKLNADGTFSMRFALPDGHLDLPVQAQSKDATQSRQITITVQRQTAKNVQP